MPVRPAASASVANVGEDVSVIDNRILQEVARRVVGEYLGVEPHEAFLIVTDDGADAEVAAAALAAALERGIDATHVRIQARRTSGEEPPAPVAAAMVAAD